MATTASMCTPAGPEPVGIRLEAAFPLGFQSHLNDGLHDPVPYRGNSQRPLFAITFGYVYPSVLAEADIPGNADLC